ncbi:MAG: hypothetical protein WC997_03175 [Porticoccaceae bacterium]
MDAFALVKSSSMILAVNDGDTKFSARNRLRGASVVKLLGFVPQPNLQVDPTKSG